MPMPSNIPIIDTMLGVPEENQKGVYDFMRPLFRDAESKQSFDFPVQYMFKDFPKPDKQEDYITYTLKLMDRYGIERGMTGVSLGNPQANNNLAVKRHPDRFIAGTSCRRSARSFTDCFCAASLRVVRKRASAPRYSSAIASFGAASVSTRKRQASAFAPVGACTATSIAASSTSGSTGRAQSMRRRTERVVESAWSTRARPASSITGNSSARAPPRCDGAALQSRALRRY